MQIKITQRHHDTSFRRAEAKQNKKKIVPILSVGKNVQSLEFLSTAGENLK